MAILTRRVFERRWTEIHAKEQKAMGLKSADGRRHVWVEGYLEPNEFPCGHRVVSIPGVRGETLVLLDPEKVLISLPMGATTLAEEQRRAREELERQTPIGKAYSDSQNILITPDDVGIRFRLRNGLVVQVDSIEYFSPQMAYPVQGHNGPWTVSGHFWTDRSRSDFDIVERLP